MSSSKRFPSAVSGHGLSRARVPRPLEQCPARSASLAKSRCSWPRAAPRSSSGPGSGNRRPGTRTANPRPRPCVPNWCWGPHSAGWGRRNPCGGKYSSGVRRRRTH
eukprot:11307991-Prorocentrum_lima.AAC.1